MVTGKVKEADFLFPDGFKKATKEDLEAFSADMRDAKEMGYIPSGGDDDDE